MTLDQSALLEVLDALKAAEIDDRVRQAAETIYQALIEAELTAVIGAAPFQRAEKRMAQRNGHRPPFPVLNSTRAGGHRSRSVWRLGRPTLLSSSMTDSA